LYYNDIYQEEWIWSSRIPEGEQEQQRDEFLVFQSLISRIFGITVSLANNFIEQNAQVLFGNLILLNQSIKKSQFVGVIPVIVRKKAEKKR